MYEDIINWWYRNSMAITKRLLEEGHDLYLLNRANRTEELAQYINLKVLIGDINYEDEIVGLIKNHTFDVVADFIAFTPDQVERDYRLFCNKTKQYIFISSASAYQKPLLDYRITESTPLVNPYWEYSRNKIACEDYLMKLYREEAFPITIVRPSHTFDERSVPVGVHGERGSYQVIKRMIDGKPIIVHGDGSSLWTLTHNSDFAKGFIGLLGNVHAIGEAVQITSDESLTWNQIYQTIADYLGVDYQPCYIPSDFLAKCGKYDLEGGLLGDKTHTVVFENNKLKRLVPDFVATKRFDMAIKESLDYILSHEENQKEDEEFDQWCDHLVDCMEEALKKAREID